jgi:hypothetical protein
MRGSCVVQAEWKCQKVGTWSVERNVFFLKKIFSCLDQYTCSQQGTLQSGQATSTLPLMTGCVVHAIDATHPEGGVNNSNDLAMPPTMKAFDTTAALVMVVPVKVVAVNVIRKFVPQ